MDNDVHWYFDILCGWLACHDCMIIHRYICPLCHGDDIIMVVPEGKEGERERERGRERGREGGYSL